jgi:NADH:ubiquinone oxidoreductase subunit 6 (subunit J)
LYNDYWVCVVACGVMLFITIIGATALTFRDNSNN